MAENKVQELWNRMVKYPWLKKAQRLIYDTPIEIGIGALLVGTLSGIWGFNDRSKRAGEIPLAFSEIEQTTTDFKRKGLPVPPLTRYYSVANDVPMKVFESNNIAREISPRHDTFARELETRVDRALRVWPQISEYAQTIPDDANNALRSLHKLTAAERELSAVNTALAKAWDENHHDVTHIEFYTTTDCDSKGNCQTTTHTRTVYDYTIHTYTYSRQHGETAAQLLNAFMAKHPDLNIEEPLHHARTTQADNEYAIGKSMRRALKNKLPSPEEYIRFANTWATGSNLTKYSPVIAANHSALSKLAPAWAAAAKTAKSARYITYSSFDSGPKEYQTAEKALDRGQNINAAARKITSGVEFARQNIPALDAKIKEYIGVTLDRKKGNPDHLRSEVMQLATDIYKKNFENGLDIQPFKAGDVVLFTLLGMVAGGLAGAGVNYYIDKTRKPPSDGDLRSIGDAFTAMASLRKQAQGKPFVVSRAPRRYGSN